MRMRCFLFCLLVLSASLGWAIPCCHARVQFDLETGIVFSGYNDVRIPGDEGTLFSLSEDLHIDPSSFFRIRLSTSIGTRHTISILVAPLRLEARGSVNKAIRFQQAEFSPGVALKSRYRFDSYRLTYRYDFRRDHPLQAGLGVTAKIRDASISLEGENKKAEKKNTGFVPLINFRLHWMFAQQFGLMLSGDALAAPQGRAEDVLLSFCYWPDEGIGMKLGYRLLEGGANNDEVYNFTLVHYLVAGAMVSF